MERRVMLEEVGCPVRRGLMACLACKGRLAQKDPRELLVSLAR